MNFIREYATEPSIAIVRTNCYGSSFEFISSMVSELKKDFPELKDEDIKIIQYGGERYSRTFGAEAKVAKSEVPESYSKQKCVENTF